MPRALTGCGTALVTPFTAQGEVDEERAELLDAGGEEDLLVCPTELNGTSDQRTRQIPRRGRHVELREEVVDAAHGASVARSNAATRRLDCREP